jgi:hypothetical protein
VAQTTGVELVGFLTLAWALAQLVILVCAWLAGVRIFTTASSVVATA